MRDTKLVPIKNMEIGKEFHNLQSPNSSRMAKFELVEVCGAFAKIKVYDKIETFSTEGLFAEVPLSEAEFKAKYKRGAAVVVEQLKNKQNTVSKEIPKMKKEGKDVTELLAEMKNLSDEIKNYDGKISEVETELNNLLLSIWSA